MLRLNYLSEQRKCYFPVLNKWLDLQFPLCAVQVNKSTPARESKQALSINFSCHGIYYCTGALCCENIIDKSQKPQIRLEMFTVCHCQSSDLTTGVRGSVIYHRQVGHCGFIAVSSNQQSPISTCQSVFYFFYIDDDTADKTNTADDVLCCNTSQTLPFAAILSAVVKPLSSLYHPAG